MIDQRRTTTAEQFAPLPMTKIVAAVAATRNRRS